MVLLLSQVRSFSTILLKGKERPPVGTNSQTGGCMKSEFLK